VQQHYSLFFYGGRHTEVLQGSRKFKVETYIPIHSKEYEDILKSLVFWKAFMFLVSVELQNIVKK
jgi:hypothetical protein